MNELAMMVLRCRGNIGVRAAAKEIGISASTLTRIEKGHVPDVATLNNISAWLSEEWAKFTGTDLQIVFRNRNAMSQETAYALADLIIKVARQFEKEVNAREVHEKALRRYHERMAQ